MLSHTDPQGNARMVDVSGKALSSRKAVAHAFIRLSPAHLEALTALPKGDALSVAQVAGIMAAKKTPELIPMCHQVPLSHVSVELRITADGIRIDSQARTEAQTGVEMEALTAAAIAALTLYDMLKAVGPDMEIGDIKLMEKTGGKRDWKRTD